MKAELLEALKRFREQPGHRSEVIEQVIEAVSVGMTQATVREHLGPADRAGWSFGLFYSTVLGLGFGRDRRLNSIDADMVTTEPPKRSRELSDAVVQQAGVAFRAHRFDRQEPAMVLLSAIEPGMRDEDLAPLFGEPDAVFWEYDLEPGTRAALSIAFDELQRVSAVRSPGTSR